VKEKVLEIKGYAPLLSGDAICTAFIGLAFPQKNMNQSSIGKTVQEKTL